MQNKTKNQTLKSKHLPQRSCIVCRDKQDKRNLIRLVCNASIVEVDPAGKKAGRGAYLCSKMACWDLGLKQNRVDHALRTKLNPENRQALLEYSRSLPERKTPGND